MGSAKPVAAVVGSNSLLGRELRDVLTRTPFQTKLIGADEVEAGTLTEEGGEVTKAGARFFTRFGAELNSQSGSRRIFCRACLDWSERRYHVAGFVGAEIWRRCLELGWLTRRRDTRAVRVTAAGRRGLRDTFGIKLEFEDRPPPHARR